MAQVKNLTIPIPDTVDRYVLGPNTVTRNNCRNRANVDRRYWLDRTNKIDYAEEINSCSQCGAYCYCLTYSQRESLSILLEQLLTKYAKSEGRRFAKRFGFLIDNYSVYCGCPAFADQGLMEITVVLEIIRKPLRTRELIGRARLTYTIDIRTLKIVDTYKKIKLLHGYKLKRKKMK
jgi:hypothetical protein